MSEHTEIAALRIGSVSAVRGRLVEIWVDAERNDSHMLYKGEVVANVSVGSFLVIRSGYRSLVVKIEEEQLVEEKLWNSETYRRDIDRNRRTLKCMLVGEFQGTNYRSGVSATPLIGNTAYIPTQSQVSAIYGSHAEGGGEKRGLITIGHLNDNESVPYQIDIAKFFASHIGIFGNTGSGKSYTLTQLYTKLLDRLTEGTTIPENTRFIIFDLNGEYSSQRDTVLCRTGLKSIYTPHQGGYMASAPTDRVPIPRQALNEPEFWNTLLEATEKTQQPFIARVLEKQNGSFSRDTVKKIFDSLIMVPNPKDFDPNLVFSLLEDISSLTSDESSSDQKKAFAKLRSDLNYNSTMNQFEYSYPEDPNYGRLFPSSKYFWSTLHEKFDKIIRHDIQLPSNSFASAQFAFTLKFYQEVAQGFVSTAHIRPLIARLKSRIPVLIQNFETKDAIEYRKPLTIIDLHRTSFEGRKLIPLILTRCFYKAHKDQHRGDGYLNIVIDEAHNLLSYESSQESEIWRNTRLETFEEIIKEGRKFGVFLTLASQRPHDISPTITSQLHHYMLHRLVNSKDLDAVRNAVSYLDRKSFDELPALPTGTCVISGTSIQLPAVVKIDPLEHGRTPKNETIDLRNLWNL